MDMEDDEEEHPSEEMEREEDCSQEANKFKNEELGLSIFALVKMAYHQTIKVHDFIENQKMIALNDI